MVNESTSMSGATPRPNQQILEEASTWFVTFRGGDDVDANTRQEFQSWLKRSPEHIRAYLEIAAVYADIPAPEGGRTPPELIARARSSPDINVVSLTSHRPGDASPQETRRSPRWRLMSGAIAATLLFAVISIGAWFHAGRDTYDTGVGEQRAIALSDGSIIELNARSKVRVMFRDQQRDLALLEGQALFRVAKNPERPFVVHAGATSVRAVGTQFDVYRKSTGTTVTVVEGSVAVLSSLAASGDRSGSAAPPAVQTERRELAQAQETELVLVAGEQAIVTPSNVQKASSANIAAATAWTRHELVFDGTPLGEVLEEFRRYSTERLILESPDLANLRISGQYTSTSPESLLRFLSLQEGVVVTRVNGETRISKQ